MTLFAFGFAPSPFQILIVLVLGVLIFGKNLPDVAKQIGSVIGEFRKGFREMNDLSKNALEGKASKRTKTEDDLDAGSPTEKHQTVGVKFVPPEEATAEN